MTMVVNVFLHETVINIRMENICKIPETTHLQEEKVYVVFFCPQSTGCFGAYTEAVHYSGGSYSHGR
jgi:hypothetical protein